MSECVVRMPYPKDCESCHLKTRNFFTGDFICAKTHTFLPASGKNNNCPIICSLPEGHGRLIDADDYIKHLFTEWVNGEISNSEWCDLRQWMNEAPTIVPAEPPKEDA